MSRVFTTATDAAVIEMVSSARTRLAVIAPGVTSPVADALARRMQDIPALSLTVILDADPEVYRMGYGDADALKTIREASKAAMFDLREQAGVRIGVIISDDRTMVFAPVSRNVEAGSISAERPNAILLGGRATEALALASGSAIPSEATNPSANMQVHQEIGEKALETKKVEAMEADLKANPPRPFDLTRRLTVFVTEVQFVELRLSNAVLSTREIRLPPHFMKFDDAALRKDIKSTLKIPIDLSEKLEVTFTSHLVEEKLKVNEADLKRLRYVIEQSFFYEWKGRGKVILRKDKDQFRKDLGRLLDITKAYREALRGQFDEKKAKFREDVATEFSEFWKSHPPEHLRLLGTVSDADCKADIAKAADVMFDKSVSLGEPEAKEIYKDISIEDLKDKDLMDELKHLMEKAGVDRETVDRLFKSGDVAVAQGALI